MRRIVIVEMPASTKLADKKYQPLFDEIRGTFVDDIMPGTRVFKGKKIVRLRVDANKVDFDFVVQNMGLGWKILGLRSSVKQVQYENVDVDIPIKGKAVRRKPIMVDDYPIYAEDGVTKIGMRKKKLKKLEFDLPLNNGILKYLLPDVAKDGTKTPRNIPCELPRGQNDEPIWLK